MSIDLNWSAAREYVHAKLAGYQLLGAAPSRFAWKERSVSRQYKIPALIIGSIFILLYLAYALSGHKPRERVSGPYVQYTLGRYWKGWSEVDRLLIFGDSWSTTCFNPQHGAPSVASPIGIPAWPGETVGNGPNWVGYLTYQRNESLILTADFAIGGAPVADLTHVDSRSLRTQITKLFPAFNTNFTTFWRAESSLFFVWIGINDIHDADTSSKHFPEVFKTYSALLKDLYSNGAKNIMIINVPPMSRSPLGISSNRTTIWSEMVHEWNKNVEELSWAFAQKHRDVTFFHFDAWQLLTDIMSDPCTLPESCQFKVVEDYCPYYSLGEVGYHTHDPRCPYSVDKYLWIDPLHPTTALQNATSHAIYRALKSTEQTG